MLPLGFAATMEDGPRDPLHRWLAVLHELYPPEEAEAWDAVGLHVGDPAADVVRGVLVCLDVTMATLSEARQVGADLLIAHHPLLFTPLARLTPERAAGRLALQAARDGIAVAAAHTNLDKAVDGTSHPAADVLDLQQRVPLRPLPPTPLHKLVTFVPADHVGAVLAALSGVGAGVIGDYEACAFRTPGTGSFRPTDAARPFVGDVGALNQVAEERVEVVVPAASAAAAMRALQQAHPYEEVAADLYPLISDPTANPSDKGLGLVGTLPEPLPLRAICRRLADGLPSPGLRLAAPDPDATVTRVAICGGAGDSLISDARRVGAEVLITGDLKHHPTLDALTLGLPLIDAGHFATEDPAMDAAAERIAAAAANAGLRAVVTRSTTSTDPFRDWTAHP